jgi:hypothetical protein
MQDEQQKLHAPITFNPETCVISLERGLTKNVGLPRSRAAGPKVVESHILHKAAAKKPRRGNTFNSVETFVSSVRGLGTHSPTRLDDAGRAGV